VKLIEFIIPTRTFFIKITAYSFLILFCTACTTSIQKMSAPVSPFDDLDYSPNLEKWRKQVSVYNDFELQILAGAVLVAPEMEEHYKVRLRRLQSEYAQSNPYIVTSQDSISIVIDLFAKTKPYMDLTDQNLWHLTLTIDDTVIAAPHRIVAFSRHELLSPFFPLSSQWSRYYIVIFKLPYQILKGKDVKNFFSKQEKTQDLPQSENRTILFSMNSGEAKLHFSWSR
jgi:hypothetical protein